jgi:outer membrane immunogenic protein
MAAFNAVDIPGLNALGSPRIKGSNPIFGGKIGYNQQSSAWVFGLEADISSFSFNKSVTTTGNNQFAGFGGFATFNTNVSTTWLATVRPRIGYAVDRALFYATGGVAFGDVKFTNTFVDNSPLESGNGHEASSASKVKAGWTAGGGVDYAVTPNWIVSVEYLHVDLGSINASGLETSGNSTTATLNFSTKLTSDLVRGGISYKY